MSLHLPHVAGCSTRNTTDREPDTRTAKTSDVRCDFDISGTNEMDLASYGREENN